MYTSTKTWLILIPYIWLTSLDFRIVIVNKFSKNIISDGLLSDKKKI